MLLHKSNLHQFLMLHLKHCCWVSVMKHVTHRNRLVLSEILIWGPLAVEPLCFLCTHMEPGFISHCMVRATEILCQWNWFPSALYQQWKKNYTDIYSFNRPTYLNFYRVQSELRSSRETQPNNLKHRLLSAINKNPSIIYDHWNALYHKYIPLYLYT